MKTNRIDTPQRSVALPFSPPSGESAPRAAGPRAVPVSSAEMTLWLQRAKELPDIRWDKVQAMREAIRNRTIDTDDRLAQLADRLPAELIEYLGQIGE